MSLQSQQAARFNTQPQRRTHRARGVVTVSSLILHRARQEKESRRLNKAPAPPPPLLVLTPRDIQDTRPLALLVFTSMLLHALYILALLVYHRPSPSFFFFFLIPFSPDTRRCFVSQGYRVHLIIPRRCNCMESTHSRHHHHGIKVFSGFFESVFICGDEDEKLKDREGRLGDYRCNQGRSLNIFISLSEAI